MSESPDLQPLPENIDGRVIQTRNRSHDLNHEIPWGQVALGVGLVALAYVAHQYLNGSDAGQEDIPSPDPSENDDPVSIEVDGGGLIG